MRRTTLSLALAMTVAALVPLGARAQTADETVVTLEATVGSVIAVGGNVAYGTDATGNVTLGTDAAGDALAPAVGLDITSLSVRTDVAARRLVWTLGIGDGLPDPVGGPPPAATAYMVPITVDGENWWRWLGAGTAGSSTGQAGKWTGLCHNETAGGAQGGWTCPGPLTGGGAFPYSGTISEAGVTWTQPFNQMKPAIQFGSRIEQGTILCGGPCSFPFPPGFALGGLASYDKLDFWDGYKVPGEVELGITAAGVPPTASTFTTDATFNNSTGAITGSLPTPATPGDYTVHARTCFGLADSPTCVTGSTDIIV